MYIVWCESVYNFTLVPTLWEVSAWSCIHFRELACVPFLLSMGTPLRNLAGYEGIEEAEVSARNTDNGPHAQMAGEDHSG